jgi:purine nucleoside phosphorylase
MTSLNKLDITRVLVISAGGGSIEEEEEEEVLVIRDDVIGLVQHCTGPSDL